MLTLIFTHIFAITSLAAPLDSSLDFPSKERLRLSAEAWFTQQALPVLKRNNDFLEILSIGLSVRESGNTLPPELGGPLPSSPLPVVVEVSFTALKGDRVNRWARRMECRISQKLLAKNNGKGWAEIILPRQPLRAPLACASESHWPNPRYPHER